MINRKSLTILAVLVLLLGVMVAPVTSQTQYDETSIAIAPLNGNLSTPIQVIANGFPPNTDVYIGIGEPESEYEVRETVRSDAYGLVTTQILIPDYIDDNRTDELVIVAGSQDQNVDDAISVPFTLMQDNEMNNPFVDIIPQSGMAGSTITITAHDFPPNEDIILGVGPQNGQFAYSLRVATDSNGNLVTEASIPQDARANRNWVVLAEVEDNRDYQAFSQPFYVTGVEPTPLPDGATFTRSDIYLIALNSSSGETIGCGDSVIPVEVTYEPTIAPLRASLEALFDIDTQMYGQSGLYNALYQSNLSVEGIDIENGVATINISGELVVGGACDTPRALAQIEQTALQFSTVDEVNIFIGGKPYL